MVQVSATEFKINLGKYLDLASREDIHITKNGMDIAVLSAPKAKRSWVDDLIGIIPDTGIDEKAYKAERLAKKHESVN